MPAIHLSMLLWGFALAATVGGAAYATRALTVSGALAATVMGTVIFGLGGWPWAAALLTFFVTSSALSRWRKRSKDLLGFEKTGRRDAAQVWANGGAATACVMLPFLFPSVSPARAHLFFLTALAAVNADTWATELGAALGGRPFLVTTGRRVERGTSGAVSGAGLLAALLGAALLGAFAGDGAAFVAVTLAGWLGALLDSVLGATVQAQWRNAEGKLTERPQASPVARGLRWIGNDAVNMLCSVLAILIFSDLTDIL